jgi:hypothetical protein
VRETAALLAALYVIAYLVAQAWRSRHPARVVVLCPLRSAAPPEEIADRLGAPTRVPECQTLAAGFTIAYATHAPGIGLGPIRDEPSLERELGRYLRRGTFVAGRKDFLDCLRDRRWKPILLHKLALEILHVERPRSLVVDFRPPSEHAASGPRVSTAETDADLGMYGYELLCRLRRYSRYRGAEFSLLFCDEGGAWLFS